MSRFVDRVEAAGYVRRIADPEDRRALHVTITEGGVELPRRMWPVYAAGIERHFGAHLGPAPAALRRPLEAVVDAARRTAGPTAF